MFLSKITIKNYRLISEATLNVHKDITLIVGRNNTAKTSCMNFLETILKNKSINYDDYPITKRENFYSLFQEFMQEKISFEELKEKISTPSIEFEIDYSEDNENDNLNALSPFIIDIDETINIALIRAEYCLIKDESYFKKELAPFYDNEKQTLSRQDFKEFCKIKFSNVFELTVFAITPNDKTKSQKRNYNELKDLFPYYCIAAERELGESNESSKNSLPNVIDLYFNTDLNKVAPEINDEVENLKKIIEDVNKKVQNDSSRILSSIINKMVGFGYPNSEELSLGVDTTININNQLKNSTVLTYKNNQEEALPNTYNGLGYKNLIKIQFLLAYIAKQINQNDSYNIPLLFIEEPESHMHPQMQHHFASYIQEFLSKISDNFIQTFITSHSPHIANAMEFSHIRYAQKNKEGIEYKDLNSFVAENDNDNIKFIKKYLTISRCDLFFADKIILVEGASERLLLPDMIKKCEKLGYFDEVEYKLSNQYYSIIEIGGAYAHKFIPFIEFLGVPCLILTDLDPISDSDRKAVLVTEGNTTSNETIKWWFRQNKGLEKGSSTNIQFADIVSMNLDDKTREKIHIEFQTEEQGLCGRSLEESLRNVNRTYYELEGDIKEEHLEFKGKCKTNFALDLIYKKEDYNIPDYIKTGLSWLNRQRILN